MIERPADLHAALQDAFNRGDANSLVSLYEPGAVLATDHNDLVTGSGPIRQQWASLMELGGHLWLTTRFAIRSGDIALLSNAWTLTASDEQVAAAAVSAEVAHRQPDGSWRYVIDAPFAVPTA